MNYSKENNDKKRRTHIVQGKRVKNKVGVIVFRLIIALFLVGCFAVAGAGIGAYLGIIKNTPKINLMATPTDETFTTIIYSDITGEEIDRLDGGENREYASSEEIPQRLKDAFVAIEDKRFYTHDGVDVKGMFRAVYVNLSSDSSQGASTITQQLIKNRLGYKNNTWDTKLQEQFLAVEYEKNLLETLKTKEKVKDYILTQYLNIVGMGAGQIGVKAATQRYFNKDMQDLTIAECATLAAITQNPLWRSPIIDPEGNKERQIDTLDIMLELEMITQEEYDEAIEEDVYSKVSAVNNQTIEAASFHSYHTDAIIEQVISDLVEQKGYDRAEASNITYNRGLQIYSSIDLEMQKILDEAFLDESLFPSTEFEIAVTYVLSVKNTITGDINHYTEEETVKTNEEADAFVESMKDKHLGQEGVIEAETIYKIPQPQAAMVVIDYHTGQVKAVAGGRGEKQTNRGLNRATQSLRQPGSVFKIIASYAPGIDMGLITPGTVIDDSPVIFPDYNNYEPKNWYGKTFRGLTTVRKAIRDSMNVVTVKNMHNIGVDNAMKYVDKFGFTTIEDSDRVLAACLGGINGISQLEVTAAYGAIANSGYYNKPVFYTKVYDHNGNLLLDNTPAPDPILKPTSAYLLTNMMQDVITSGTGTKARFKEVKMPIAGKTGTTTATKDLTFVGYTPYYVAGIWLGYDQPKQMDSRTEGVHSLLWSHIMEKIHENLEYKEFEQPEGIVTASICTLSGMRPTELCEGHIRSEIFAAGTQPAKFCDMHETYEICIDSGKTPNEFCPPESIETKTGIKRKQVYEGNPENMQDYSLQVPDDVLNKVTCDIHTIDSILSPPTIFDADGNPVVPESADLSQLFPQNTNPDITVPPQGIPVRPDAQTQIIDEGPIIP